MKRSKKVSINHNSADTTQKKQKTGKFQNRIPSMLRFVFNKKNRYYSFGLIFTSSAFLFFALSHLGKHVYTDEPVFWYYWIAQFGQALQDFDFSQLDNFSYPGLPVIALGSLLTAGESFIDIPPEEFHEFLFRMKSPIVIFNFLSLFIIYFFIQRLWGKKTALLTTGLIALHPLIIAFSQHTQGDTTLWNTMFITILAFFIYLKTGKGKYIILTALFFALTVLSKFFGMMLYPLLFIFLYAEYVFNHLTSEKFKNRFKGLIAIYALMLVFVFLLFPQCYHYPMLALRSTFLHYSINRINYIFLPTALLLTLEIVLLNGKISEKLRKFNFEKILSILLFVGIMTLLLISVLPDSLISFLKGEQSYFGIVHVTDYTLSIKMLAGSLSAIIPWYVLVLPIIVIIKAVLKKEKLKQLNIFIYSAFMIFAFLTAAIMGNYIVWVKYLLFLIPPIYLSIALVFVEHFKKTKILIPLFLLIAAAEAATVYPTYFSYRNRFIPFENHNVYDGNYGGYEAAQAFNKLPGADTLKTISDTFGFKFFAKGYNTILPQDFTENMLKKYRYAYLTSFGKTEKTAWAMVPYSMRLLYDMPPDSALFFLGNKNQFVKIQEIPEYNYKYIPENHFDTDFFVDMNKNQSICFWLKPYKADSLNALITLARKPDDTMTIKADSSQIIVQNNDSALISSLSKNNIKQHICLTNRKTHDTHYNTLYINGKEVGKCKYINSGNPVKGIFINILFSGNIQDFRIYDKALDKNQLQTLYNHGQIRLETVLMSGGKKFAPVRHFTRK